MSRANWGKARNQIYALRPDILGLAAEGKTVEEIRRALAIKLDGIGTRTFLRHASDIIKDSRAAHLKRLLDDNLITPEEFEMRDTARVGAQKPWLGLIPKPQPAAPSAASPSTSPKTTVALEPRQARDSKTIITKSSLKKDVFNDPSLRVATEELMDELYGPAKPPTDEKE